MMNRQSCPDILTSELVDQYKHDGYLAFTDVLSQEEVDDAKSALSELVRRVSAQQDKTMAGSAWFEPGSPLMIEFERGYLPSGATDTELEIKVRKLMGFATAHHVFESLANDHPHISSIVRTLLGEPEILMQDMALIKPPYIGSEKPWHQDDAYFAVVPLDAVVGVWIALDDAAPDNGCMHVIPGGHLPGPRKHLHLRDCEIPASEMPPLPVVPVPLPPGGALFFSGLLPHQTPPNTSPLRRRALQFHYRAQSSRFADRAEYDQIFADHNGPASCAAAAG